MRKINVVLGAALAFGGLSLSVWAQEIVIGQSVPLSGSNADIGRDMRDGALAIFNRANASNQLGGRKIKLVTLDNANNRQRAAENSQQLITQNGAHVLFGYNSATTSIDALSQVVHNNMLFFAPFSGSPSLRSHPNIYSVRASYRDEVAKIMENKRSVGANKAVVLYYDDDVGQSNYDAVASVFVEAGVSKPKGVAVKRGAPITEAQVAALTQDQPHYVLATTQFNVVGEYLKISTDKGIPIPVAALSFVNPDELVESVGNLARGTVVSQVMPSPRAANQISVPIIKECAEALAALNGAKLNYTNLESCIAAKALVAILRKAGNNLTREGILKATPTVGRIDLGGFVLNYGPGQQSGSTWVDLTILSRGSRFVQ
ncbi:ABC transporter substrate-binding protein [Curvibacter sp. CHRR-16]|uniref:ABC transporter substrate-binding protein n=1 Tax=Curvibacter sp. CHRR-16 TaxID=2835872 RepID=UPI001BDB4606|nr:ABC transporter substrate-binding protein [Curvibacter sp. CHRR-16]MBT0571062.1 ABC transporter substrate-binding protein [Curvibacter sp. CHRR-16]